MRRSVAQSAAGLVLNEKANVRRTDFDRLKATLHNAIKTGPETQNLERRNDFRSHLAGRIAHVRMINEFRGRKLEDLFNRVQWSGTD